MTASHTETLGDIQPPSVLSIWCLHFPLSIGLPDPLPLFVTLLWEVMENGFFFSFLLIVSGLTDSIFSSAGIDFIVIPVGFLLAALISLTRAPPLQGSGSVSCNGDPTSFTWVSAVAKRTVRTDRHLALSPILSL